MRRVSVLLAACSRSVLSLAAKAAYGRDAARLAGRRHNHGYGVLTVKNVRHRRRPAPEQRTPAATVETTSRPTWIAAVCRPRSPEAETTERKPRRIGGNAECVPCRRGATHPRGQRARVLLVGGGCLGPHSGCANHVVLQEFAPRGPRRSWCPAASAHVDGMRDHSVKRRGPLGHQAGQGSGSTCGRRI